MNIIWARSLVSLILLAIVCGVVGVFFGAQAAAWVAALALLGLFFFNVFHQQKLWRLLDEPVYGEVPSAPGGWGEIFFRLHKLARRWHEQVRQVEQQHTRFIQAIQASPNGVAMLDERDQIEWCNAIAGAHLGLDTKRDLRQRITYLVRSPEFVRYLDAQQYDATLLMRGMGEKRQFAIAVQVFPYGENRKLILTQDVTELERTNAMRRDFVANVSHELKTPLTVLSGFLETIRELPLSEADRQRYLGLMEQQALRMRNIVADLLTLAKLESDAMLPDDQAVNMRAVLAQVREDAQSLSGGKRRLTFSFDDTLSVTGAEKELLSAFGNLVTNAVRYTPEGGTIQVTWQEENGCAVFSVADSGIGIPAAHLPRLTERFYRVDRSRSRDTGGTGLGLAIVRHVLQRHDALFDVKSDEGKGSTFVARFPAARTVRR